VAMVVFGSSFAVPARRVFCIPPFFFYWLKRIGSNLRIFFGRMKKINVKCVIIYW